jgi:hypothetical protein
VADPDFQSVFAKDGVYVFKRVGSGGVAVPGAAASPGATPSPASSATP